MAQISGNFYRVDFVIVTPNSVESGEGETDPPSVVSARQSIIANAATPVAAETVAVEAASLTGSQVIKDVTIQQIYPGFQFWQ